MIKYPHSGEWGMKEEEEQLAIMTNMYDSFIECRDRFRQLLLDEDLRKNWKDVVDWLYHDGNHDAEVLRLYTKKKAVLTGWRSLAKTFSWIRLMNLLMELYASSHPST